jgi:hypothetical protein
MAMDKKKTTKFLHVKEAAILLLNCRVNSVE